MMRKAKTFSIIAVLTLAIGIGANTAIFSVIYGVLLKPLPYRDPDRVVVVWENNLKRNRARNVVGAGHDGQASRFLDGRRDRLGIGCNYNLADSRRARPSQDVYDHRLARDIGERLAR